MQSTITERITELIKELGENTNSFSSNIGVSQSTIATALKRNKGVNSELIEKICIAFPIINKEWLLLGKGEMFYNSSSDGINQTIHGDNNQQAGKTITNADNARLADRIKELEKQIENKDALINSLMKQLDKLTDKL